MLNRRGFITGLIAFTAAAPTIIRASSLMKVRVIPVDAVFTICGQSNGILWAHGENEFPSHIAHYTPEQYSKALCDMVRRYEGFEA